MFIFFRTFNSFFEYKFIFESYHIIILKFTNCTIYDAETSVDTGLNQGSIFTEEVSLQSDSSSNSENFRKLLEERQPNTDTNHFHTSISSIKSNSKNILPIYSMFNHLDNSDPTDTSNTCITLNYSGPLQTTNLDKSNKKSILHNKNPTKDPLIKKFENNTLLAARVSSSTQNCTQVYKHRNYLNKDTEIETKKTKSTLQNFNNSNPMDINMPNNNSKIENPKNVLKEPLVENLEFEPIRYTKFDNIPACEHRLNNFNIKYGIKSLMNENKDLNTAETKNQAKFKQVFPPVYSRVQNVMEQNILKSSIVKSQQKNLPHDLINSSSIPSDNFIDTNNKSYDSIDIDIIENQQNNEFHSPQKINIASDSQISNSSRYDRNKLLIETTKVELYHINQNHYEEIPQDHHSLHSRIVSEHFEPEKDISDNIFEHENISFKKTCNQSLNNSFNIEKINNQNSTFMVQTGFDEVDSCILQNNSPQSNNELYTLGQTVESTQYPSCSILKNDIAQKKENNYGHDRTQKLKITRDPLSLKNVINVNFNAFNFFDLAENAVDSNTNTQSIESNKQENTFMLSHMKNYTGEQQEKINRAADDICIQSNVKNLESNYHNEKNLQILDSLVNCEYHEKNNDVVAEKNFKNKNGFVSASNHQRSKIETLKKDCDFRFQNKMAENSPTLSNENIQASKEAISSQDYSTRTNFKMKNDGGEYLPNKKLSKNINNDFSINPNSDFFERPIGDKRIELISNDTSDRNYTRRILNDEDYSVNILGKKNFLNGSKMNNKIIDPIEGIDMKNVEYTKKFRKAKMDSTSYNPETKGRIKEPYNLYLKYITSHGYRFFNGFVVTNLAQNNKLTYVFILKRSVSEIFDIYDQLKNLSYQKDSNEQLKKFSKKRPKFQGFMLSNLDKYHLKTYLEKIFHRLQFLSKHIISMFFEILMLSKSLSFEFMPEFYCIELVLIEILNKYSHDLDVTDLQVNNMKIFINSFAIFNSELCEYIKLGKNPDENEIKYFNRKRITIRKSFRIFLLSFMVINPDFDLDYYLLSHDENKEIITNYNFFACPNFISKNLNNSKTNITFIVSITYLLKNSDLVLLNYGFPNDKCTFAHLAYTFQCPYYDIDTHKLKFIYLLSYLIRLFDNLSHFITSENIAYQSTVMGLCSLNPKYLLNFENIRKEIDITCRSNMEWSKDITQKILSTYGESFNEIWKVTESILEIFLISNN